MKDAKLAIIMIPKSNEYLIPIFFPFVCNQVNKIYYGILILTTLQGCKIEAPGKNFYFTMLKFQYKNMMINKLQPATRFAISTILLFLACFTLSAQESESCESYKKADKELNDLYKQIMNIYSEETVFLEKLKAAQRSWLVFRDNHLESFFPEDDKRYYGSVYTTCKCETLTSLTKQRNDQLKIWMDGIEEGDACSGSIRIKDNKE